MKPTIKRTAKNQEVLQSKGLPGSLTIRKAVRKSHNQKDYQGVLQSKGLPGSDTIKVSAWECYNLKDCKEMSL